MTKRKKTYSQSQLIKLVERGRKGKYYAGQNLYLKVKDKFSASWFFRRQLNTKRIERRLGAFGQDNVYYLDYTRAVELATKYQQAFEMGQNPFQRDHTLVQTLNDLVRCFIQSQSCRYKAELDIFHRELSHELGEKRMVDITRYDLEMVLKKMVNSGRKSIALRTMYFFKALFNYASLHHLIIENVASHLHPNKHAANDGSYRQVTLSEWEIETVFSIFQEYPQQAPVRSQIAISLYLIFGCRKTELLKARWCDFDFERQELLLRPTKMGKDELLLSIPSVVMPLFKALKALSNGSSFLFPTAKNSMSGHLSESTLNAMLLKFFTRYETRSILLDNPIGRAGVRHFWIHDLRRTFSTFANESGAAGDVTDSCLNHKKRGQRRRYDLSVRQYQRKSVYETMAEIIYPLTNLDLLVRDLVNQFDRTNSSQAA